MPNLASPVGTPTNPRLRVLAEGPVLIPDAFRAVVPGSNLCSRTFLRWATAGVRGIRLETIKVGGKRLTSVAAMERFLAATQNDPQPRAATIDERAADKVLEAYGLGRKGC